MFMGGRKAAPTPRRRSLTRPKVVVTKKRFSIGKAKPVNPRNATFVTTPAPGRRIFPTPTMHLGGEVDAATQRGNIKVVVRVRPPNSREIGPSRRLVVQAVDSRIVLFDPLIESSDFYFHGIRQNGRDFLKKPNKDKKFVFDHVFGPESTNNEIFEETVKPTIDTIIAGFNCSVFAYGATGSGKTFTMVGCNHLEKPGLQYLMVMELYKRLEEMQQEFETEILISYLEVYNEQAKDLLKPSDKPLTLLEDAQGVVLPNLSHHKPRDADHILQLLHSGNDRRSQHPTDHNHESSRSHAVFQVFVKLRRRYRDLTSVYKASKLVMVDLAGSERGTATGYKGVRFREGASINKSLLALGNCINALADGKKHIPYRDSKLTRILKDALGGNCKTVMIANVSPSELAYEDSFNTLQYADRAKRIKFSIKKNTLTFNARAAQYTTIVNEMSNQIALLEQRLQEAEMCRRQTPKVDAATDMDGLSNRSTPNTSLSFDGSTTYRLGPYGDASSSSLMPVKALHGYAAANVMKLESYKKVARLLDEKTALERRSNGLMSQLRDVELKLKQREVRINGAMPLVTNEEARRGIERMKKQYETLAKKKHEYDFQLRDIGAQLVAVKRGLIEAENGFCGNGTEDVVQISRQEFLQLRRLQAEKSIQSPNIHAQFQYSLNGIFDEFVKTETLLQRGITQLKPAHLTMKHVGHTTMQNEREYEELMSEFFCNRIHFAVGEDGDPNSTVALSPYWQSVSGGPDAEAAARGDGEENNVTSSTGDF